MLGVRGRRRLSAASGASTYPANRDFKGHVGGGAGRSPARILFIFSIFSNFFVTFSRSKRMY